MAHDHYDTRQGPRDDRGRWSEDRYGSRERSRDDDRSFFERAGEEISSWFGGDRDPRDRDRDFRDRDRDRDLRGEQRGAGWREIARDERSGPSGGRDWRGEDRNRNEGGYRPMTGDYGRHRQEERVGPTRRPESNWDRDDYRRTEFAGSRDRSNHPDPHYHDWRQRQIGELDRDYEDYRREHQQRFESEFGSWREKRQTKRQMLGQVREHMEVVGSDGGHVGTVDKVAGDRIILTKSDPEAGGVHHSITCHNLDRIEDNRLILDWTAEEARRNWTDENSNRALFESEDRGEAGAHILDRSFSGTYR